MTRFSAWLTAGSPVLAEHVSVLGFEAVVLDAQHGTFGADALLNCIRAVGSRAETVVRVSELNAGGGEIAKALDGGAKGLICPMVTSASDCRLFVDLARYPPHGRRSFGPHRAKLDPAKLGLDVNSFVTASNKEIKLHAMIETRSALDALDEILDVDGLDGVFIGPFDLALALGYTPTGAPSGEMLEIIEGVVARAHKHKKQAGIFTADGAVAKQMAEIGFDWVNVGMDTAWMMDAAKAQLAFARGVLK